MLIMEAQVILLDLVTPSIVFPVPQELHRNLWPCDNRLRTDLVLMLKKFMIYVLLFIIIIIFVISKIDRTCFSVDLIQKWQTSGTTLV